MSTNYYFRNKEQYVELSSIDREIKSIIKQIQRWNVSDEDLFKIETKLQEVARNNYEEIHIGKRSVGWMPLFEKSKYFSSVKELEQFYKNNKDVYEIVDEYNRILTWDELKEELINWKGDREHEGDIYKDEDGYQWSRFEFS